MMNAGDLVEGNFDEAEELCYGIVMASKAQEYIIIRWLDTGETTHYDLAGFAPGSLILESIKVISESR